MPVDDAPALPPSVARPVLALLWLLLLVTLAAPLFSLHASSLWKDELFSIYFSDPAQPTLGAMLHRAAEDVHPPGYYLLLHLLRAAVPGDAETVGRAFSAVCAAAAVIVTGVAVRSRLSPFALVVMLLSAGLSQGYFEIAAELRSYGLCALLVSIDIALLLPLIAALRAGAAIPLPAVARVATWLALGGLVHSYLVLLGVALAGHMVLAAHGRRDRAAWVIAALLIASCAQAVMLWQRAFVVPDLQRTWFSAGAAFMGAQLRQGVGIAIGSKIGLAVLLLTLLCARWRSLWRSIRASPQRWLRTPAALCCTAIVATTAAAVGYSLLVIPVLSFRLFFVLAPFFWLATGLAMNAIDARGRGPVAALAISAAVILTAPRLLAWPQQRHSALRASADAIARAPGCDGATIPVIGFDQPYVRGDEATIFYGHYLPGPARLVVVRAGADPARLAHAALAAAGRDRSIAQRRCAIMLWSVDLLDAAPIEAIANAIRADPAFPRGRAIAIERFPRAAVPSTMSAAIVPRPALPDGETFVLRIVDPRRP